MLGMSAWSRDASRMLNLCKTKCRRADVTDLRLYLVQLIKTFSEDFDSLTSLNARMPVLAST